MSNFGRMKELVSKDIPTESTVLRNKIGECFSDFCKIFDSDSYDEFGQLWLDTMSKLGVTSNLAKTVKMFKMNHMDAESFTVLMKMVLEYPSDNIIFTGSKLYITYGDAMATIHLFWRCDSDLVKSYGFTLLDYAEYFGLEKLVIYVSTLISNNTGDGKRLIKTIQKIGINILLEAGFLFKYDEDNNFEYINKLVNYYESLGFDNVNEYVGDHDTKVTMLYSTENSKDAL